MILADYRGNEDDVLTGAATTASLIERFMSTHPTKQKARERRAP
jgi:hypothetical protein